jgi:hypothetical protein
MRHRTPVQATGFNLVRSRQTNGMGIYAGLVDLVLRSTGQPVETLEFEERGIPDAPPSAIHPVTISAATPGHIAFAELQFPRAFSSSRHRSAIFMWDVDVIPNRLRVGFRFLDELWTASSMGAAYLRTATAVPVAHFPAPILKPPTKPTGSFRRFLDAGDKFLVAYQFDIGSSARRKNPAAAISIYKAAFPRTTGETHLILKCTRADVNSPEWKELQDAKGSREDITLVNEFWDQDLVDSMYRDLDCYLSPHRSEGYGLTIAEALAHGIYVIATAYGGPMDFMNPELSGPIPCRLVSVGQDPIYPAHARWADPNIDDGADLLRQAFLGRDTTKRKALQAQQEVLETFTVERAAEWIKQRTT